MAKAKIDITAVVAYLGSGGEHKWLGAQADDVGTLQVDLPHRGPGTTYSVTASVTHPTDMTTAHASAIEGAVVEEKKTYD